MAKNELAPTKPRAVEVETYPDPEVNGQAMEAALLNVFQSVEVRHPAVEPFAVAHVMTEATEPRTDIG